MKSKTSVMNAAPHVCHAEICSWCSIIPRFDLLCLPGAHVFCGQHFYSQTYVPSSCFQTRTPDNVHTRFRGHSPKFAVSHVMKAAGDRPVSDAFTAAGKSPRWQGVMFFTVLNNRLLWILNRFSCCVLTWAHFSRRLTWGSWQEKIQRMSGATFTFSNGNLPEKFTTMSGVQCIVWTQFLSMKAFNHCV